MKAKIRAWLVHLGLSALIVGPVLAVIYFIWFPAPYFQIQGTSQIVLVLIGVDLVLGPLLTFIVYKPGKPGLKFDLWVIAILQVVALVYGAFSIHSERPSYMVFAVDRFEVLAAKDVDFSQSSLDSYGEARFSGPQVIFAQMPSGEEYQKLLNSVMFEGKPDVERRPEYWRPFEEHVEEVLARAGQVNKLALARPAQAESLAAEVASVGLSMDSALFVPLIGKRKDFAVIIDPHNGVVKAVTEVDPWLGDET
jgi:hypothetical protein